MTLLHILPFVGWLFLLPATLQMRKDKRLHRAAILEVRTSPLNAPCFEALEAWQAHNRRLGRKLVVGLVLCTVWIAACNILFHL